MLITLFWLFALITLYSYFLYPLLLLGRTTLASADPPLQAAPSRVGQAEEADPAHDESLPKFSVIIAAHNEEKLIAEKLANTLALDYPTDRLEIIVASDASTDATDDIVANYADQGITLVRASERLGKENAQHHAIEQAEGEILVFSDVATELPSDALYRLAHHFADPRIGAVSSEDRFISQDGSVAGEGLYVRYEMWLRQLESRLAGLVGLSGSFFAARRSVYRDWDIHTCSDFNTALSCARVGLKAVSAPDVLGYYHDLKDPSQEYPRKVRTVLRGMTGLGRHADVLNPARFGWFAMQVFSHKLMRWAVPWALLGLLLTTAALADGSGWFRLLLLAQLAFYALAVAAHVSPRVQQNSLARIVYFFVQVNLAIAHATLLYFRGKRVQVWQPSAR